MTALADAHIEAQARLRRIAEQTVASLWMRLPAYDEEQVPDFTGPATGVVIAAQRQSVSLTNAYLARVLRRQPLPIDVAGATGAAVRSGVEPAEVYRRPFVTVWTALKNGKAWEDAVHAGLERATSTAAMDVQLSMRATLSAVGEADDRIVGYARVPDGGACEFCRLIAGQRYRTDQLMPVHNRCGCGVDVITTDNRHEFSGKPENDLSVTRGDVSAAVHEHGELGPVLADGSHDFTAL